jgi:citrate lyase beta subunit
MTRDRSAYLHMRTMMETPILDERKWAKAQTLDTDSLFIDLEDTIPEALKETARERAARIFAEGDPDGPLLLGRPNKLDTPWGHDDVVMMAQAGVRTVAYPKLESVEELHQLVDLFHENGADPDIFATVESAAGVRAVEEVVQVPQVCGVMFGPGDLAVDVGIPLGLGEVVHRDTFMYARERVVMAAAEQRIARFSIAFTPDIRDLDAVRVEATYLRQVGFTGLITFYPPHLGVIHEVFTPSVEALAEAREVVERYEKAVADGQAAILHEGRTILIHDYERCQRLIERADRVGRPVLGEREKEQQ